MLEQLRVENLLLLDQAELRLAPGLNVLTGETGAGKTLLAHALDLLLGGRARSGIVRGGAAEAYVEGIFSLPDAGELPEIVPSDCSELVLARRVWRDGRTRAYVCGRAATVASLRQLADRLLAFYGQHEHRKLTLSTAQLEILDAWCGQEHIECRGKVSERYRRVRELEELVQELTEAGSGREREIDLLRFELEEIEKIAPARQEEEALRLERDKLRHVETLRGAVTAGANIISPDGEGGVGELLAQVAGQLGVAAEIDPALRELTERLDFLRHEAQDVGGELRSYALGIEEAPGSLEQVEERLAEYARLERKHGTVEDVLRHAERCRGRLRELEHVDVAVDESLAELEMARGQLERLSDRLGAHRRKAAPALAAAVRGRLAELAMPEARFEVEVSARTGGCGPTGADAVELMIAAGAGMPAGPLKDVASGGELSRVMLALLSAAQVEGRGDERLLVFDEIDAGVGGHTARAVGRHLRELAEGRQLLCITHLPQVAAQADRHFTITKDPAAVPASTAVAQLNRDAVVAELVRMLGAGEGDRAASQHARALLRAA